jgi:hypothetical protein
VKRLRWLAIPASLAVLWAALPWRVGSAETVASRESIVEADGGVVALVTGDVVEARDGAVVSVRPGKGRERVGFLTQRLNGRQYVLPGRRDGPNSAQVTEQATGECRKSGVTRRRPKSDGLRVVAPGRGDHRR